LRSLFGAPCPKKEQKMLCLRACIWSLAFFNFGASRFWGFAFGGLGLFRAPRCLDPALKQGTKKSFGALHFGASIFNFWGPITFSGDLGLFGAPRWNTKTGNKKKTFGVRFWGLEFSGGLRLFGAPLWRTVWAPRWNRKQNNQKKNRREKRGAPKSAGAVAYAASAIWLIQHCQ
jgi:hypothetical protein